jgi:hypothetical protein
VVIPLRRLNKIMKKMLKSPEQPVCCLNELESALDGQDKYKHSTSRNYRVASCAKFVSGYS